MGKRYFGKVRWLADKNFSGYGGSMKSIVHSVYFVFVLLVSAPLLGQTEVVEKELSRRQTWIEFIREIKKEVEVDDHLTAEVISALRFLSDANALESHAEKLQPITPEEVADHESLIRSIRFLRDQAFEKLAPFVQNEKKHQSLAVALNEEFARTIIAEIEVSFKVRQSGFQPPLLSLDTQAIVWREIRFQQIAIGQAADFIGRELQSSKPQPSTDGIAALFAALLSPSYPSVDAIDPNEDFQDLLSEMEASIQKAD
jgi:hypothetical protein